MKSPYGLPVVDNCTNCSLCKSEYSCNFSLDLRREFDRASHPAAYPEGAILAVEGQAPSGVYLVCSGEVKLTSTSKEGKSVILRIARAGEFVGLSPVLSGTAHGASVETLTASLVRFVSKQDFTRLMQKYPELGMKVARSLSAEYAVACQEIRALAMAPSSAGRLASLLVSWCPMPSATRPSPEIKIKSGFTHEEIASMIGTTRETVTRVFSDFNRNGIVNVKGSTLVVRDRKALEAMAV
jgi:CRP/FNR family transcriptional regulator